MNILKLEKRGCDFTANDERVKDSDIGNYRVTTTGYDIHAKNGRDYFIEVIRTDRWNTRVTHKVTGKPLKHPKRELVTACAASLTACYIDEDGFCYADLALWREANEKTRPYTIEGILDIVNTFAAVPYDAIEFVR